MKAFLSQHLPIVSGPRYCLQKKLVKSRSFALNNTEGKGKKKIFLQSHHKHIVVWNHIICSKAMSTGERRVASHQGKTAKSLHLETDFSSINSILKCPALCIPVTEVSITRLWTVPSHTDNGLDSMLLWNTVVPPQIYTMKALPPAFTQFITL